MAYEIPQEIQYKEIIAFGLNWKQLIIAFLTVLPAFFILIKSPYSYVNQAISALIALSGVGLMFLEVDKKVLAYLRFHKFKKANSTDSITKKYFNIKEIENNILVLKSKEKGFSKELSIVQVEPVNIVMKGDLERESLGLGFQKFLNGLDFPVQFLITTNKNKNSYIRNFYVVVPKVKDLDLQTNFVIKQLKEIGLKSKRLDSSGVIQVFNDFFKEINTEVSFEELEKNYAHYLLAPTKIENHKTYLKQDNTYCRVISAVGYPRHVQFGFLNKIIKLQKDIDISIHVEPFSIEKLTIRLNYELKKQLADLYTIKQQGSANPALEIKHADTRRVLEDLQKGEEKLFLISLYINCKGSNLRELDEITQTVIGELNSLLIVPEIPKFLQAQAFKSCLPYCQSLLEHKRNITTKPLSAFFPFTSKFHTEDENGILFGENENKLPVKKDVFKLPNHNGVILASSGGGKSYLAKLLVQRFAKQKSKVFIIDPEGEYKKIVEELGGQVITIGIGGDFSINPLDFMDHTYDTKRLSLHEIFHLMFNNLGDLQRSVLDKAITEVYDNYYQNASNIDKACDEVLKDVTEEKKKKTIEEYRKNEKAKIFPKLSDVYEVIKEKEKKIKNPAEKNVYIPITYRLSLFTEGAFKFLNKNTNINLEKDVVCFHLKDLPSVVQPVLMYLIMDFLYNNMKKTEGRKILFVDEAWSLVNKTDENSFLFKIIKTCRKYNMGVFLISQEVEDLIANKTGKALLSNSSTTILLKQKPNVIKQLDKVFNLNKEEISILLNANVGNSIMIFDDFREQVRITSTEKEHSLITTTPKEEKDPGEKAEFQQLLSKPYFRVSKLDKPKKDYLIRKGYSECNVVPIGETKPIRVLVKRRGTEGPHNSFLVFNLIEHLENFTDQITTSEKSNPDISFVCRGEKYAIEVETGENIDREKDKDRILEKVKELKENFSNRIIFVLTDSRYTYHYEKYGIVSNRKNIMQQISVLFGNQSLPTKGNTLASELRQKLKST